MALAVMDRAPRAVFLHGWCGHADEADHLRAALPTQLLAPNWMPAPGSIDLTTWPGVEPEPAMAAGMAAGMAAVGQQIMRQVRETILDAGFAGSLLIGHSMGGAMACLLAADPVIAARGLVLLDSSVPMPPQRRSDNLERMGQWVARAIQEGRSAVQAAWVEEQPQRTHHFFASSDQGSERDLIERRMAHAPVVEAAATLGGYVQWPIDGALAAVRCPILAFAADPCRLPEEDLRSARPDATIHTISCSGHFLHVFAAEQVRAGLESWWSSLERHGGR
ncbi:MAG: alpha/beta fold hydrolase [Anaerolineae bacterium]